MHVVRLAIPGPLLSARCHGVKSTSISERSVRPYSIAVSPMTSEVSRSPGIFCSDQSARLVSIWKRPAGTVQVGVDFPGRLAQIGCSPAAAAALVSANKIAPIVKMHPRMRVVCMAVGRSSSEHARFTRNLNAVDFLVEAGHQRVEHGGVHQPRELKSRRCPFFPANLADQPLELR